jgi:hypothetical protein
LVLMSVGFATAPSAGTSNQGMFSLGMTDGTRSWVCMFGGDDGPTTIDSISYAKTGEMVALCADAHGGALDASASLVSLDADGFTLDWTARASTRYVFYLAFEVGSGGRFRVDSTTTRTDGSGFNGPTCSFDPRGALFASACRAESTAATPTDHGQFSIGAAESATVRAAHGTLDQDAVGTSETARGVEYDAVYLNISTADAVQGLMDITSWADPLALVMDDADPSASFVAMAVFGEPSVGGSDAVPQCWRQYRGRRAS